MEKVFDAPTNCYNFTDEGTEEGSFLDYGQSIDMSMPTIWVMACFYPPYLFYKSEKDVINGSVVGHYQWCGPMMTIMVEFAKLTGYKYVQGSMQASLTSI